ncbi:hypothetical protein MMC21_003214 [Puttea exsequens]|nr:hypothetical protein [Puttea exsequens]
MIDDSTSPLLTLPIELRLKIWSELLCPNPSEAFELYHDMRGRGQSLNAHPLILTVSRQIYEEAWPLLYEKRVFDISLTSESVDVDQRAGDYYPDSCQNAPALFRYDETNMNACHPGGSQGPLVGGQGVIYPHCLPRFRHVRLSLSRGAIWGKDGINGRVDYFSHIGRMVMKILDLLLNESSRSTRKRVLEVNEVLTFRKSSSKNCSLFQPDQKGASKIILIEILTILKKIQRTRRVRVEEIRMSGDVLYPVDLDARTVELEKGSTSLCRRGASYPTALRPS